MTSPTCRKSGLIGWQRGNGVRDIMTMLRKKKIKKSGNAKNGGVVRSLRKITPLLHGETLGSSVASISPNSSSTTIKLAYSDVARWTEDSTDLQHEENTSDGVVKSAEESKVINHGYILDSDVAGSILDGAAWHYGVNQDSFVAKSAKDISIIKYDAMQGSDVAGWYWDGADWQYGENLDSGVAMWSGDCNAISLDADEVQRLRQELSSEKQEKQILEQQLTLERKKNDQLQQNYEKLSQETNAKLADVADRSRRLHKHFLALLECHEESLQKVEFLTELVANHKQAFKKLKASRPVINNFFQVFVNSEKKPSHSTNNEETPFTSTQSKHILAINLF